MYLTEYGGHDEEVRTTFATDDEEPTVCCLNDDCPGVEVVRDDSDEVMEVVRIAWDAGYVSASGPSWGSGGETGYERRPDCPQCGESGDDIDSLL